MSAGVHIHYQFQFYMHFLALCIHNDREQFDNTHQVAMARAMRCRSNHAIAMTIMLPGSYSFLPHEHAVRAAADFNWTCELIDAAKKTCRMSNIDLWLIDSYWLTTSHAYYAYSTVGVKAIISNAAMILYLQYQFRYRTYTVTEYICKSAYLSLWWCRVCCDWQLTSTATRTTGTSWSASISVSSRCRQSVSATMFPAQTLTRGRLRRSWSSVLSTCWSDSHCWQCVLSSSRKKCGCSCDRLAFALVCWTPMVVAAAPRPLDVFKATDFDSCRNAHRARDEQVSKCIYIAPIVTNESEALAWVARGKAFEVNRNRKRWPLRRYWPDRCWPEDTARNMYLSTCLPYDSVCHNIV